MKLWIARDKNNALYLYDLKPSLNISKSWVSVNGYFKISDDSFPEVTFENSPKQVEIKLCSQ